MNYETLLKDARLMEEGAIRSEMRAEGDKFTNLLLHAICVAVYHLLICELKRLKPGKRND